MHIPENSKKVFSGKLFNIYQWEQEMYDGSYEIFEMVARQSSVDVIGLVGDDIIVLMQEQPTKPAFLSLPGGRIERGQTPEEAAHAELLQETGYCAKKMTVLAEFFGAPKFFFPETVFVGKDCKKIAQQNLDSGERIVVTLQSCEQFLQLCRNERFSVPIGLKLMMYETLLDPQKKEAFKQLIYA